MPTANVCRIAITRLDRSEHQYSERRATQPRRGEIVEIVVDGLLVNAEVERHYLDAIRPGKLATWQVKATEI